MRSGAAIGSVVSSMSIADLHERMSAPHADRRDLLGGPLHEYHRRAALTGLCTYGVRYNLKLDRRGDALSASISTNGGQTYTVLGGVTDATYWNGRIGVRAWDTDAHSDDVKIYTGS